MEMQDKSENSEGLETAPIQVEELLPMASGLGSRRKPPSAQPRDGLGRKIAEDDSPESERGPGSAGTSGNIGRGGASAIAMLVIFLPIVIALIYFLFEANARNDQLKAALQTFNQTANAQTEADFATLLSESNLQILPFKSEDNAPFGRVVLYSAGRLKWGFSYGKLDPLPANQSYVMWLLRKATPQRPSGYERLALMPDVRTGGRTFVIRQNDFPPSFLVVNYAELVVTVEPTDQLQNEPTGPRRFSLDLAPVAG